MNLDMFLSGMPCCRYVLLKLKYEEDALCFTKFMVRTLHAAGMPANDICGALAVMSMSLPLSHPLMGYDFSSFKNADANDAEAFVKNVLSDDTVAEYSQCFEYCKTFGKSTKFCDLCALSKYYKNRCGAEEMDLVRYALESKENLSYLLEQGITADKFSSVVDMHGVLRLEIGGIDKPFTYPVCHALYSYVVDNSSAGFYGLTYAERCSAIKAFCIDRFSDSYNRVFGSTSDLMRSMCGIQVDNVAERRIPKKKTVDKGIVAILGSDNKAPAPTVMTSNIKSSNIVDFYTKEQIERVQEQCEIDSVADLMELCEEELTVDALMEFDEDISFEAEAISFEKPHPAYAEEAVEVSAVNVEDVGMAGESVYETTGEMEDVVVEGNCNENVGVGVKDGNDGNEEADERLLPEVGAASVFHGTENCEENKDRHSGMGAEADELSYRELGYVYKTSSVLYDNSDKAGFLGIPIVKKSELEHFSLCLDDKVQRMHAMLVSHTMKDKRLSIELVVLDDKKTYYVLLFSPKLHAYFHTALEDACVKDMLSPLLSYPSIAKYCYYPYFIASFLMKAGIYIKGLVSLFSLSAMLYGQHNLLIDECLDNMGAIKAEGGVHIKPQGEITSLPLLYMHCYSQVYQRHSKGLTAKGFLKELEERNCFDVLLGRYYYQDLYSKKHTVLFTLKDSVGYHFINEENEYKVNGYILTYSFKHLPLNLSYLLRELLCRLENKGYFKKYGVMITGLGPTSFSIFVTKEDMRKIDTLIDTTLVFFLRDNELYGVRYSLNRKVASVPEKKK